jgi:hypothetical protein
LTAIPEEAIKKKSRAENGIENPNDEEAIKKKGGFSVP